MFKDYLKKIICGIAVAALCFSMLTACGSNGAGSNESAEPAIEMSDTALVVNGEKVTASKFRFYIFNAAYEYAEKSGKITEGLNNIDWNAVDETSGKVAADIVRENAKEMAISDILMAQNAGRNGLSIEEEMLANDTAIQKAIEENGEEAFNLRLNSMGIISVDDYKELTEITVMADKLQEDFDLNPKKYIENEEELKEFKSDDKVTAQHILITANSKKVSNPETVIGDVLERAKSGEDFYALMEEYNEDEAETQAGYYFGRGEMSPEFEEAAFDLDLNEISDVVRTEHGYHIIKRLTGMGELLNSWRDSVLISENEAAIKSVSIEDVINMAADATMKLQEKPATATANAAGESAAPTSTATSTNKKD